MHRHHACKQLLRGLDKAVPADISSSVLNAGGMVEEKARLMYSSFCYGQRQQNTGLDGGMA